MTNVINYVRGHTHRATDYNSYTQLVWRFFSEKICILSFQDTDQRFLIKIIIVRGGFCSLLKVGYLRVRNTREFERYAAIKHDLPISQRSLHQSGSFVFVYCSDIACRLRYDMNHHLDPSNVFNNARVMFDVLPRFTGVMCDATHFHLKESSVLAMPTRRLTSLSLSTAP